MSLVTSADPSASAYGETRTCKLKGSSIDSGLIAPIYNSMQKYNYGTESYKVNYSQQHFSSSPSEELPASQADLSCSSTPRNSVNSFIGNIPDPSDYEGDGIKLKLKELERALLSEDDEDDEYCGGVYDPDGSMEIDSEWADPSKNLLLLESPEESSSYESNSRSASSNEVLQSPAISSGYTFKSLTPKQLLFSCAAAVSEGNLKEATTIISELRDMVSIQGDPAQRIAAYMVEGFVARMAASGKGIYKALKCKEPPTSDRLSAMQVLFEVCPCFKFGFMAANGSISEAMRDEKRVHIVDFDVNQGTQYITLMQTLAARKPKPPYVRITGVDDPESVQRSIGGLKIIGQRLAQLAEVLGMPFEFQAVAANIGDVTPSMLDCRPGEALIVNFTFQLHHMPDESVSTVNQRDQLLRMVKSLNPKLVTLVEQDVNTNTSPFLPRFVEAYNYYSAVFKSLDATLPRESAERMNVEKHCLARDIVNIVACEGEERIERYEVAGKWRARMTMAGFKSCTLSSSVKSEICEEISERYCNMYEVKEEGGALQFGWADKLLIFASAWR